MRQLLLLLSLSAFANGCGGGGGGGLSGHWAGEIDLSEVQLPLEITLQGGGDSATGSGTLDCSDYVGEPCRQDFQVEVLVEDEEDPAAQLLDVHVSDCTVTGNGSTEPTTCTDPDNVIWDGASTITGQWEGGVFSLSRG